MVVAVVPRVTQTLIVSEYAPAPQGRPGGPGKVARTTYSHQGDER